MKESTRETFKDIFAESPEDRAKKRPSRILFVVALVLAGAALITGDHFLRLNIGLASITTCVISTYLLVAPKGAARVITLVTGSAAILGMAVSNVFAMTGAGVPVGADRVLSYLLLASLLTQVIYTVKNAISAARAEGQAVTHE
jgi:hypothetical protein